VLDVVLAFSALVLLFEVSSLLLELTLVHPTVSKNKQNVQSKAFLIVT
jgi:hypothetical protein